MMVLFILNDIDLIAGKKKKQQGRFFFNVIY